MAPIKIFLIIKDWQGNVRVTIDRNGNVVEAVDYYPYGMVMEKDNEIATDAQPYKYGGKELDRRFGYDSYDFEARVYDPALGRFTTPDPLAWDTPWVSPYSYCAANPIRYIDPTGETIQFNGNQEDLLLVLDILNESVGDYYQFTINEKNELEMQYVDGADLSQMNKSQQLVAKTMQQMIDDGYTSINVEHQSDEYIIGRNETNSIDISDINAIGSGDKPMTSIGALTHEMYENHLTQTMGLDLNAAHKKASTLEGKVTGYYISPYSRNFSASGVSVFNVDFPKNSGKVILYHSNNNLLYILHNR